MAEDWNDIDVDDPNADPTGLRAVAKAGKKSLTENAQLKRELAFARAGIDPDTDPKLGFFIKGYDGELSTDAIRRTATELGFIAPVVDPAAAQNQVTLEADQRVQNLSPGAAAPATGRGGVASMEDTYKQVMATTNDPNQARAAMYAVAVQNGAVMAGE